MNKLILIEEPQLQFGLGQVMEDPRDGLTLFGPLDRVGAYGVRTGIIGTNIGITRFNNWVSRINNIITNNPPRIARPPFPGFEQVFKVPWSPIPTMAIEIDEKELKEAAHLDDPYQRVFNSVDIYARRITEAVSREEAQVDIWFIIVPQYIYNNCRPRSVIDPSTTVKAKMRLSPRYARELKREPSFFDNENILAEAYNYEINFHNQLKAKLLTSHVPTQVIREPTIAFREFVKPDGSPIRDLSNQESAIAWNIAAAVYYKVGGRPWKLASVRDGVCYLGMVFKQDDRNSDPRMACCAAQMFLDSGDGVVFKGAVGPWYSPRRGDFHLNDKAAFEIVQIAMSDYRKKRGRAPTELFIHGRIAVTQREYASFKKAAGVQTNVVAVQIQEEKDMRLYRLGKQAVLRGTALIIDNSRGILWARGFTPRLLTYPGREVPLPLFIKINYGESDITTVMGDILALTKLNYNACIFSDGVPVTIKFADAVGEILTAGPIGDVAPLPFKYYI